MFFAQWPHDLSIVVHDQFDKPLGTLYDGAGVEESLDAGGFFTINQQFSGGAYTDPVAFILPANEGTPDVPYPSKDFILQNTPADVNLDPNTTAGATGAPVDANAKVKVDGFPLEDMVGRQVQLKAGNILKIIWP